MSSSRDASSGHETGGAGRAAAGRPPSENRLHARARDQHPGPGGQPGRGGDGRGPAEHEPRQPGRAPGRLPGRSGRRPTRRGTAWACSPTCRGRRSGWARSPAGPVRLQPGPGVHHQRPAGRRGTSTRRRPPTRAWPTTCGPATPCWWTTAGWCWRCQAVRDGRVRTRVIIGGVVSDHKGLNLPGVQVSVPALTAKDEADLRWALRLRADMIALSFVQGPADAAPARQDHGRGGRPAAADREDRETAGPGQRWTRSSTPSTGSWSRAATSAWNSRWSRCRWRRSGSSAGPGTGPSR